MKNANVSARDLSRDFGPEGDFTQLEESINSAIRISGSVFGAVDEFEPRKNSLKGRCKKARYRDLEEAIEVLHRIERYRGYAEEAGRILTHRKEQRAYKCPNCRGAHLTSKPLFGEMVANVAA